MLNTRLRSLLTIPLTRSSSSFLAKEKQDFTSRCQSLTASWSTSRWKTLQRPYQAEDVISKQGSIPPSPPVSLESSRKLFDLLSRREQEGKPVHTIGAIDPVQVTQMARAGLEAVYVSGWACSSLLTTGSNELGPDLADYPYTTVPNQVQRLCRAQTLHDRIHYDERVSTSDPKKLAELEQTDYLRPIIADGDAGHGGVTTVMKLAKLFAESGAAAVHFEDQMNGAKKCGHQSGKIVVPVGEHLSRLSAARLQWDIMGAETLLISRTDAESSRLISSDVDARDHPFILGTAQPREHSLAEYLLRAKEKGAKADELENVERVFLEAAQDDSNRLVTFDEAVKAHIESLSPPEDPELIWEEYQSLGLGLCHSQARANARQVLGYDVHWECESLRTAEGFYRFKGGIEAAIQRALHYAPYADLLWLETKKPDLTQAKAFARRIREVHPGKMLVYNLSPSFNWSAHGFGESELKSFVWDLAKEGFVLQLISLAGLHASAVVTSELASAFRTEGMLAYVNLIQQKEREIGCDVLTHQKWSGSQYVDRLTEAVSGGSSTAKSTGEDSTENTF
ncbi:isocitrate lyase [Phaffia rhodozyma]|uniref:Isocitrate lyase n=1 Tax=Phaffia rhodozyma TaxID=264483 RepID=A0A0F7SWA3_PHARH|nr:isocitrate lyase [Phaffia rhodozyma]